MSNPRPIHRLRAYTPEGAFTDNPVYDVEKGAGILFSRGYVKVEVVVLRRRKLVAVRTLTPAEVR